LSFRVVADKKVWRDVYEILFSVGEWVPVYFTREAIISHGLNPTQTLAHKIKIERGFFLEYDVEETTKVYELYRSEFWKALRQKADVLELKPRDDHIILAPSGAEEGAVVGRVWRYEDWSGGVKRVVESKPEELVDPEKALSDFERELTNRAVVQMPLFAEVVDVARRYGYDPVAMFEWRGGELVIRVGRMEGELGDFVIEIPKDRVTVESFGGDAVTTCSVFWGLPTVGASYAKVFTPPRDWQPVKIVVEGPFYSYAIWVAPREERLEPPPRLTSYLVVRRDYIDYLCYLVELMSELRNAMVVEDKGAVFRGVDYSYTSYVVARLTAVETHWPEAKVASIEIRRENVEALRRVLKLYERLKRDITIGVGEDGKLYIASYCAGSAEPLERVKEWTEALADIEKRLSEYADFAVAVAMLVAPKRPWMDKYSTLVIEGSKLARALGGARKARAGCMYVAVQPEPLEVVIGFDAYAKWSLADVLAAYPGPRFTGTAVDIQLVPVLEEARLLRDVPIVLSVYGFDLVYFFYRFRGVLEDALVIAAAVAPNQHEAITWLRELGLLRPLTEPDIVDVLSKMPGASVWEVESELLARGVDPTNAERMLEELLRRGVVVRERNRYYLKGVPPPPPPPPAPPAPPARELQEAVKALEPDVDKAVKLCDSAHNAIDSVLRAINSLEAEVDAVLKAFAEGRYHDVARDAEGAIKKLEPSIPGIESSVEDAKKRVEEARRALEDVERRVKELRERAERAGVKPEEVGLVALEASVASSRQKLEAVAKISIDAKPLREKLDRLRKVLEEARRKAATVAPREPPEKPREVEFWERQLRVNIVGWRQETPPGFRYPVWVIWVVDEGSGSVVRAVMGYPYTEHHRYKLVRVVNKQGYPVNLLVFAEDATLVEVKVPPAPEVSRAIEVASKKVEAATPPDVKRAYEEVMGMLAARPFSWSELKRDAKYFYERIPAWESAAEQRNGVALYSYIVSFLHKMEPWIERLGREVPELHKAYEVAVKAPPPKPKLPEREVEELWRLFSEILRKHGVDPEKYREEFLLDVAVAETFKEAQFMVTERARFIVTDEELKKLTYEVERPRAVKLDWKQVSRGVAYIKVRLMLLLEACEKRNLEAAYRLVREAVDAAQTIKEMLLQDPAVRRFKEATGLE
jgi:archaellum component FlaC